MLVKGVTGRKLLLLNCLVGTCAGSAAGFCNTYYMRAPEREKGIDVFLDEKCERRLGTSKKCAEYAV